MDYRPCFHRDRRHGYTNPATVARAAYDFATYVLEHVEPPYDILCFDSSTTVLGGALLSQLTYRRPEGSYRPRIIVWPKDFSMEPMDVHPREPERLIVLDDYICTGMGYNSCVATWGDRLILYGTMYTSPFWDTRNRRRVVSLYGEYQDVS